MSKKSILVRRAAPVIFALGSVSCMTTYDPYGRPMRTVDPVVAVAGAAAVGLLAYAAANHGDDAHHDDYPVQCGSGPGGHGYGGYGGYDGYDPCRRPGW